MGDNHMATYKINNKRKKYHDEAAYKSIETYVTREHTLPEENIIGWGVDPDSAAEEMEVVANAFGKNKGRRLVHEEINFDPEREGYITPDIARRIVQEILPYFGEKYQQLATIHEDRNHLHVHIMRSCVNFNDGSKYRGSRKDHYDYMKHLNKVGQRYGVKVIPVSKEED